MTYPPLTFETGVTMPLFHVQDCDRPMFVKALDYNHAVQKFVTKMAEEDECRPEDITLPQGVQYVCDDDDFLA